MPIARRPQTTATKSKAFEATTTKAVESNAVSAVTGKKTRGNFEHFDHMA